jgi:hypothetical protein
LTLLPVRSSAPAYTRPPIRTTSAIATSMSATETAISQPAASPAAIRTGITSGDMPGTNEVTVATVEPGSWAALIDTMNPTTSSRVVGVRTLPRSSCRLTREAAAAKIEA